MIIYNNIIMVILLSDNETEEVTQEIVVGICVSNVFMTLHKII
jgi:hypothetical protein